MKRKKILSIILLTSVIMSFGAVTTSAAKFTVGNSKGYISVDANSDECGSFFEKAGKVWDDFLLYVGANEVYSVAKFELCCTGNPYLTYSKNDVDYACKILGKNPLP